MIYYKKIDDFGVSYGVATNLYDLIRKVRNMGYTNFKAKNIDDALKFINAKRITQKEYFDFMEKEKKVQNMKFIGNAKIIDLKDLSKVGDIVKSNICGSGASVCIECKIYDFKDNYIIYKVMYCKLDSINLLDDLYCDCYHNLYAIKIEDLGKEA